MAKKDQSENNSGEKEMSNKSELGTTENTTTPATEPKKTKAEEQVPNLDDFKTLFDILYAEKEISKLNKTIYKHLYTILARHKVAAGYEVLFLYDNQTSISESMADKIYEAIPTSNTKPILLIINNIGGRVEPAYLISKTCKENSTKFNVAIPRRAKSAATLIALGANEIHMGSMSELGPIDPQFGGLPALGLTSSLESLAKVVTKYPKSSEMLASFLSQKLDLRILGYFERVSESTVQYATRLLAGKKLPKDIDEIAKNFVYEYKDHSFVVDKEEATKFLGDVIKVNTPEYQLANEIHQFMSTLNLLAGILRKKNIAIIGNCKGLVINEKEEE
jgi:ClpP class serine protease